MGNVYGYARVSTREQNEDRQLVALDRAKVPQKNIYLDKAEYSKRTSETTKNISHRRL